MSYVIHKSVTFEVLERSAVRHHIRCDDPLHDHQQPFQEAYVVEYRNHHVSVVKDGDYYDVEIDRDSRTIKEGMSRADAISYIESMTEAQRS